MKIKDKFRMGIDPRPDWFIDKVNTNEIITYYVNEENDEYLSDPFEFKQTYAMIGNVKVNYGEWIGLTEDNEIIKI